jgi:rhamnogalacturonan endolyase
MKRFTRVSVVAAVATVLSGTAAVFALNAHAQSTRYEAENASCDGTIDSNHSGFSGSGFCNTPNTTGAAVQFTVNAPSAGIATLAVRYANGASASRPADVSVNGAGVQAGFGFDSTGAWNSWATRTLTAQLNAGSNTVRLAATTAGGLGNIDYLDVTMGGPQQGDRRMENLDRGVVAVRSSSNQVLVSWRLLGLDPDGIGFNVYRSTGGGSEVRLNSSVLTGGTNFVDSTANLGQSNTYQVRPVINGTEQPAGGSFTLSANNATEPVVRVPIRNGGRIDYVWVGDLTGDGAYDFVLVRQTAPQTVEAYRSDGQFLWDVNMGPNSLDQNNIEGGSATLTVGHNDGITAYDFDSDGRAEVAVRIANGVRFGDGTTFNGLPSNTHQAVAILDGMTGAPRATAQVPTDYLSDGPMYARFGVGHLDGVNPSLVAYMKNRVGNGGFNLMLTAWRFTGSTLTQQWKFLRGNQDLPDGHNTRSIDVDGNGTDEVAEIGFVLNGDGTLRYSLGPQGVVHGDRFHIADIDPNRPGLEGYAVQQNNPSGLLEYYYDAASGQIIWRHSGASADVGRGMAGDIDPRFSGMEVWSFSGLYNGPANQLTEPNTSLRPWPQLGLWWDGDVLMELLNDSKFEQWDWNNPTPTNSLPRLLTTSNFGAVNGPRNNPALVGDILGDWREEAVYTNGNFNQLIIFTTNHPTDIRLYTLAHNPAYRNAMTFKGYMQSHHVDYFLGQGMTPPPRPNISYAG